MSTFNCFLQMRDLTSENVDCEDCHLLGCDVINSMLERTAIVFWKTAYSSPISLNFHQAIWHHIADSCSLAEDCLTIRSHQIQLYKNVKSCIFCCRFTQTVITRWSISRLKIAVTAVYRDRLLFTQLLGSV